MRRIAILSLVIGLLVGTSMCGVGERILDCEEAAAHLAKCCPHQDPHEIDCSYSASCGERRIEFDLDLSRCILALSCEQMVAHDMCNDHGVDLTQVYSGALCK